MVKNNVRTLYCHIHVHDRFEFELTVYPTEKTSFGFKSSITGKPIERASESQLLQQLEHLYPDRDIEAAVADAEQQVDPLQLFYVLLLPLEKVIQSPAYHPEGDALYHTMQVFDRVCDERPYDEELLTAALLHDVGKGIDRYDHVAAGLEAIGPFVSPRTHWLIEYHMLAHQIHDRTIGVRAHRRLREHEDYEDLLLLSRCDRAGRVPGVQASELDEAIDYLRDLANGSLFG